MSTSGQVEQFVKTIRGRNRREIVVGIVLLHVLGLLTAVSPWGSMLFYGHALLFVGILFIVGMMWFVATPRGDFARHPATEAGYWRAEMRRQARLLRWVPLWYLAPLLPGMALVFWSERAGSPVKAAIAAGGIVLVFAFVAWLNVRAARQLERDADALANGIPVA